MNPQSDAYSVAIAIGDSKYGRAAVTALQARTLIEDCLAAWGRPKPDDLRSTATPDFLSRLAQTGEYTHEASELSISVHRAV